MEIIMNKKLNVLSCFDGISCARVAIERAGFEIETYYASEIDKYAMQVAQKNYPDTIQLGSVTDIKSPRFGNLKNIGIDILIGGSPCQDLSIAKQGREGLDGARSGLFWEYLRIRDEVKPKYFILENVNSMPKEAKAIITKAVGVEPIMINASLVSAQNRKRLFWVGKLVGDKYEQVDIELPEDKRIFLKDILEEDVEEKYFVKLSDRWNTDRLYCDSTGYNPYSNTPIYDKTRALNTGCGSATTKNATLIKVEHFNKYEQVDIELPDDRGILLKDILEEDVENKYFLQAVQVKNQGKEIVKELDKAGALRARDYKGFDNYGSNAVLENSRIRKLTPIECERLQGLKQVEKYANIVIDNNEINFKWLKENQKENVQFVEKKCLRLQNVVGNVEKLDLKEFVQYVEKNLNIKNLQIKKPVVLNVLINLEQLDTLIIVLKELLKNVNIVEKNLELVNQKETKDFVLKIVGKIITLVKIVQTGKVELLQKEKKYILQNYGKEELEMFGKEIMQLAKDVEKNLITLKKLLKYITSKDLNIRKQEQNLIILFYYVINAINLFTQKEIKTEILLRIDSGYTEGVSNTQRYKALGNAFNVDVVAHIIKSLDNVKEKLL